MTCEAQGCKPRRKNRNRASEIDARISPTVRDFDQISERLVVGSGTAGSDRGHVVCHETWGDQKRTN